MHTEARPSLRTEGAFHSHNMTRILSPSRSLSEMRKATSPVLISSINVLKTELGLFLSALSEEPWTSTVLFQLQFWKPSQPVPQSESPWPEDSLFAISIIHPAASFHWEEWPCISQWGLNWCSLGGWEPNYYGLCSWDHVHSQSEVCVPQWVRRRLQWHLQAFLFLQGKGLAQLRAYVFQGIPIAGHTILLVYQGMLSK